MVATWKALALKDEMFSWKGGWVTSTLYAVNDCVEKDGSGYICVTAHTSGTFATDLVAGKWDLYVEGYQLDDTAGGTDGLLTKAPTSNRLFNQKSVAEILTNKTLTSPVISGAGAATAATYGYDATNHTLLVGDGASNNPIHVGHWQAYTPNLYNLTLGNGTITGSYCQVGKLVVAKIVFTMGSTSAMGTVPYIGLPVTAKDDSGKESGLGYILDSNTGTAYLLLNRILNTGYTILYVYNVATYVTVTNITSTIPFTWAVSDIITLSIVYEAA